MRKLTGFLTIALFVVGCAKQRGVEHIKDPEGTWVSKSSVAGNDWMMKATIVKTSSNNGFGFVGLQSEMRVGYFEFTKEKLKFYNTVTSEALKSDSKEPEIINSWSVTHLDRKLSESNGKVTNKEAKDEDKTWSQKRFFEIDFSKADISEAATFPYYVDWATVFGCWAPKTKYLVDDSMKIEKDAVSFVVGVDYQQMSLCTGDSRRWTRSDFTYTVHYRYSFKKVEKSDYKPYMYAGEEDPVMKRFGYFQTIHESLNKKTGVRQNRVLMNRWNPEKTHTYYYAKGFPEKYKWMFDHKNPKGIFYKTNELLAKNKLKMRFEVKDYNDGDVEREFGDLRYSFVKFVEDMDPGAPLGYGPSDANPFSGEIVAANLVMWTGYLKYYVKILEDMQKADNLDEIGRNKFERSTLYREMKSTLKSDHTAWVKNFSSETSGSYQSLLPKVTFGFPGWARFTGKSVSSETGLSSVPASLSISQVKDSQGASLFKMNNFDMSADLMRSTEAAEALQLAKRVAAQTLEHEMKHAGHPSHGCAYDVAQAMDEASVQTAYGKSAEDIINAILYRTAIHELGHNLGLRHNFYGTVDKLNFRDPSDSRHQTSSVMDYLGLKEELDLDFDWEPYDEAAILYSASHGQIDEKERTYLFCTDEHTILNALCNRFDSGHTPSQIAMSIIENFEDRYQRRNYRYDRAYWNTQSYASSVFSTMHSLKKFLPLWRRGLKDEVLADLPNKGHREEIRQDIKQAIKLSMAFYNAVLQQSSTERPFNSEYEPFSGETKRLGIFWDKLYAMYFLAGDDAYGYDPNRPMSNWSLLTYNGDADLAEIVEEVHKSVVVKRVDMQPWFLGFGRSLYAMSASNVYNEDNTKLLEKIRVAKFDAIHLKKYFNIKMDRDVPAKTIKLKKADDGYFRVDEEVGIVNVEGSYYMMSKESNPYSFTLYKSFKEKVEGEDSLVGQRKGIMHLHNLYQFAVSR